MRDVEGNRLCRRRYSCAGEASARWRIKPGESQYFKGVVLGEPGCAYEKEEGETALGLYGEKAFSP
jgi:hypothetical protein